MKWKRIAGMLGLAAVLAAAAGCAGNKKTSKNETQTPAEAEKNSSAETETGLSEEIQTETDLAEEKLTEADTSLSEEIQTETETSLSEEIQTETDTETSLSEEIQDKADTETDLSEETSDDAPLQIHGTILSVSEDSVTVDNQSEHSAAGEMILRIDPEHTRIVDGQTGLPAVLTDAAGTGFTAYLGQAMTMSIPPQTTPLVVIVNLPEDSTALQYVIAAEDAAQNDGVFTVAGTDGNSWEIAETAELLPFRTKNIVTAQDITAGRELLIWQDAQGQVTKVILFE